MAPRKVTMVESEPKKIDNSVFAIPESQGNSGAFHAQLVMKLVDKLRSTCLPTAAT